MGPLFSDLKFGARTLAKKPGSAIIAVFAFGLGIGLCTFTFSIVYGVFMRGLAVPEADRIALIHRTNLAEDVSRMGVPQHDFYDWKEQQQSFEDLATFYNGTVNVSGVEGPERYAGAFVTAKTFDLLRVRPAVGGTFRDGDDRAGAPLTVVLGYEVWQDRYGGDPGVVGATLKVNGEQATILGVMEDGFRFPQTQQLWVAWRDDRPSLDERDDGNWSRVFGRLKDGITHDQAALEMAAIAGRLAQEYPETNEGVGVVFGSFVEDDTGPELRAVFGAMQVATIFVLLIACANVANLLLSRAALRTKEAAVRSALGAGQFRVVFPFFSEALILAGLGAVLGIAITYLGVGAFDRATTGVGKPYYMEFAVDLPILAFVLGVTALTALAAGAAPAFQIAKTDVNGILKDEARGSSSMQGGKLSRVLVVAEIALSCALLIGAGLMTKSMTQLSRYEFPFPTETVFTARVGLFETDYPSPESRTRFFDDLRLRLEGLPGSVASTLTSSLPGAGSGRWRIEIEGETYETDQDYPRALISSIAPGFFETFDSQLLGGRDFSVQDDTDAPLVAIVNQRFAERFFPGQDPVGRRFRSNVPDAEWISIVGIAPNLLMEGFDPDRPDPAGFYLPVGQRDNRFLSIAVRAGGGDPLGLTSSVRNVVRTIDPDLPIYNVETLQGLIDQSIWFFRVFGTLFIIFGAAALFMASVGLYGVLAFSVSRRVQELGIRMALGANARDVLRLVLRQGAIQLAIGLTLGLGLAFGTSGIIGLLMYDVQPRDPSVFGAIVLVITLVSVLAAVVPARRATGVDPMVALRYE